MGTLIAFAAALTEAVAEAFFKVALTRIPQIWEELRAVNTSKAVESKPDPGEQKDLQDALQDAIDSGAVPRP
jgi:hypothetical protein